MTVQFRYIGEYPEGAESLRCFDVVFTPGAAVEVPDRCVAKARGNRFFEEVMEPAVTAESPEEEPRNRMLDATAPDKDALIAIAGERGVKIDKRWNADKIAAAIEASVG